MPLSFGLFSPPKSSKRPDSLYSFAADFPLSYVEGRFAVRPRF